MTEVDPQQAHALAQAASQPLVPAAFAEKAMASLMQMHGELMEEKERRVQLFRQLMEKEQALAELKMYVKVLEEKAGVAAPEPAKAAPPPPRPAASENVVRLPPQPQRAHPPTPVPPRPPMPAPAPRPSPDGWRAW